MTVTHDALLLEAADDVRVVDAGRVLPSEKGLGGPPSLGGDLGEVSLA